MAVSMQVAYPRAEGTTFDFEYYLDKHFALLGEHFGPHIQSTLVTRGADDAPYHAIATLVFADAAAREAALAKAAPVVGDIPNFTNSAAQIQMGDVVA